MNIIKRIKYFFLSIKAKQLQERLKKTTKLSYSNKTSKTVIGVAADLNLVTETQKKTAEVKENIEDIVKKTDCEVEALLSYVKSAKTPVFRINYADKILKLIHEEEGLIFSKCGFEALYLSLVTGLGFRFSTPTMFILNKDSKIDKFYLLHHFYRWYSFNVGLPGFETKTQALFKIFLLDVNNDLFNKLSMQDIMDLKEAIARDNEATNFVLEYTRKIDGSKNVMDKIKDAGSANI